MSPQPEIASNITVKCLGFHHLDDLLSLQASLPEECREFLKVREREDLEEHLDAGMPIIGVWHGDDLMAYALLTYPSQKEHAKYLEGYPENPDAAILQSVVSMQKGGLTLLLNKAKELALENGYTNLQAKVNARNEKGLAAFGKKGFDTVEIGTDPIKGYSAHFIQAVISPESLASEALLLPVPDLPDYQFQRGGLPLEYGQAQL